MSPYPAASPAPARPPVLLPIKGKDAELVIDCLPGASRAYAMRSGSGSHHLIGGEVATVIARAEDTQGAFEAIFLSGGIGAGLPLHHHVEADAAMLVLDGQVELTLAGQAHLLSPGDYAMIPAGTVHAHRLAAHRSRVLLFTVGAGAAAMAKALGTPFTRPLPPEGAAAAVAPARLAAAAAVADVVFDAGDAAFAGAVRVTARDFPGRRVAYVLRAGEGERLSAADQLFTFLTTCAETDGRFIAVMTEGPAGDVIAPHYHAEHTENFLCLDGLMTMMVNGTELHLHPGDYLQVPAGHVHAYRLDAPYTRFFGWLAPGLFEPFFRLLGDPYEPHVCPVDPQPLRFDRVLAQLDRLDLYPVGRTAQPA